MKPQFPAAWAPAADPDVPRGPWKVSCAECIPRDKDSPRQSTAGQASMGNFPRSTGRGSPEEL